MESTHFIGLPTVSTPMDEMRIKFAESRRSQRGTLWPLFCLQILTMSLAKKVYHVFFSDYWGRQPTFSHAPACVFGYLKIEQKNKKGEDKKKKKGAVS